MKKTLLFLAAALLGSSAVIAQPKKTWDFTKGLSDETVTNLNADATNWASNGTDADGNTNNWKNNAKINASDPLMANGVVIAETEGLLFNIGSNGGNSIHLAQNKIRLTRKSTKITFPKLANGQTVTIVGRSANGTATNRGIAPVQSHLKLIEGTTTGGACIFVGNQVEGSLGTYSFTWEVQTESADSVEVSFSLTPDGGIDFTLFQIDNGDAPEIEEDPNVAYIYSGDIDAETFLQTGIDGYATVTGIPVSELLDGTVSTDSLMTYDVAILAKSAYDVEGAAAFLSEGINYVPMLNLWPAEGLGYIPANITTATLKVSEDFLDADLFQDVELGGDNGDELVMFNGESGVLGYTLAEGSDFAGDDVYAKAGDADAIHHHYKRNTYLLIPIDPDQILADGDLNITEAGTTLISNAIKYLRRTKVNVVDAPKPGVSFKYEDGVTTVTLSSSLAGATIYYTTDGTRPSTESASIYTEPLVFTEPATLMAKVKAPSYNSSDVVEAQVIIKNQLAAPAISVDGATVTITAADGATVYYNYLGSSKTDESVVYTEPFTVAEPTTITAFATSDVALPSEVTTTNVTIDGYVYRYDIIGHFDAKRAVYGTAENFAANTKGDPYLFSWGNKAVSPYDSTNVVGTHTVPAVDGSDSTVYDYAIKAPEMVESEEWYVASSGQMVTNEKNNPLLAVGDGSSGYYAESAEDTRLANDSIGVTSEMINFSNVVSKTPTTANITSKVKFTAPFDIIVYTANGGGGSPEVEIQVSADGQTWDSIAVVKFAKMQRYRCRTKVAYETAGDVYVRVAHTGGSTKAVIYDIYVLNAGEHTQEYLGIRAIEEAPAVTGGVTYNLFGQKVGADYKGIVIRDGKKLILR